MFDTLEIEEIDESTEVIEELEEILEIKPARGRKRKDNKETTDYVDKDAFWQEIKKYYISLGDVYDWKNQKLLDKSVMPVLSRSLCEMLSEIARKMGNRPNFINYSWVCEMIGDSVLKSIKAIRDCSFKCYTTAKLEDVVGHPDGSKTVYYLDKKNKLQSRPQESTDHFFDSNGEKYVTFHANAFGYFSRIVWHSYLNRIKVEVQANETKKAYMDQEYEKVMQSEAWKNVKRQKYFTDEDHDEAIYESE